MPILVYQAPWNWDFVRNRAQPLAEALSKHVEVHYLDCGEVEITPRGWWQRVCRRFLQIAGLSPERDRTLVEQREILPGLNRWSWKREGADFWRTTRRDRSFGEWACLRRFLEREARKGRRLWLLNSRPATSQLLRLIPWEIVAVDLEDYWPDLEWFESVGREACFRMLTQASLITVNGAQAASRLESDFGIKAQDLPNGVDKSLIDALEANPQPPSWLRGEGKHAVFIGTINNRMDLEMMADLASTAKHWKFWFIGPNLLVGNELSIWKSLMAEGRWFHVGAVAHEEIPKVLAGADALMLIYRDSVAQAMFPAKFYEYVAARKPIVTNLKHLVGREPEARLYFGSNVSELVKCLEQISFYPKCGDQRRNNPARDHLWSARAKSWLAWVQEICREKR